MTDPNATEEARKIFAHPCAFTAQAVSLATLPPANKPEVAFAGRSNVGKSSLLNALVGRKVLARTSASPGRTRALNVFDIDSGRAAFVDMPGYGYAGVSKAERAGWAEMIASYLHTRRALRGVLVLVDGRHGLKDSDHAFFEVLVKAGTPCRVILTKADKVKAIEVAAVEAAIKKYPCAFPQVLATSAHTGQGIAELRVIVAQTLGLLERI